MHAQDVVRVAGPKWAHLYMMADRALLVDLLDQAHALGFAAVVLTCDHPHERVRDTTVPHFQRADAQQWISERMHFPNIEAYYRRTCTPYEDPVLCHGTWDDVEWIIGAFSSL